MKYLIAVLLALSLSPAYAEENSSTGAWVRLCMAKRHSNMCLAYLQGLRNGSDFATEVYGKPSFFCAPVDARIVDMRDLWLAEMAKVEPSGVQFASSTSAAFTFLGTLMHEFKCP